MKSRRGEFGIPLQGIQPGVGSQCRRRSNRLIRTRRQRMSRARKPPPRQRRHPLPAVEWPRAISHTAFPFPANLISWRARFHRVNILTSKASPPEPKSRTRTRERFFSCRKIRPIRRHCWTSPDHIFDAVNRTRAQPAHGLFRRTCSYGIAHKTGAADRGRDHCSG
jgi:hypothetical protein